MGYAVGKLVRIIGPDNLGGGLEYIGSVTKISVYNSPQIKKTWGVDNDNRWVFPESSLQLLDENALTPRKRRIQLDMEV